MFASEEYCEYVNSPYNDVFGFFISGPGFNGGFTSNGENIALVPGSSQFVAINTVNHLQNQIYFNPNQNNCNGTTNMTDIQFDGYTTILTATAVVVPCATYHIRLVVGDVGDGIYDSAVFLEANSFTPGNAVAANVVSGVGSSGSSNATIYEGCTGNFLVFERQNNDNSQPITVSYIISNTSTATAGVDYDPLPVTVTIPAGQDTVMIPLTVFADGIPEGVETIVIELDNPCTCTGNIVTINIEDVDLQAALSNINGCGAAPQTLTPSVEGGPAPYSYVWSNGATTPSITVSPPLGTPTTYVVTVTDACGNTDTAAATVTLAVPPTAVLSGNGTACGTGTTSVDVTVTFTGTGPWQFVYTINGAAQPAVTTSDNPYTFTVTGVNAGDVIGLLSVDYVDVACPGAVSGTVTISQVDLQPSATTVDVSCAGANDGQINLSVSGGTGNYSYQWSGGLPSVPVLTNVPPGTYTVTVTDNGAGGCMGTATVTINEPPPLDVSISTTPVNCNGGGSISVNVTGGTPAYTYIWSDGLAGANPSNLSSGTYDLTVSDANGCTDMASVTIGEDLVPPTAAATASGIITCAQPELTLSGVGSSTGSNFTYQWSGPGIVSGGTTLTPTVNAGGTYTLTVTDESNGCTATATVSVPEDTTPPTAVASGGTITCYNPLITINGVGSSTGSDFTYQWSGPGIVSGGTTLTPTVNAGGSYTLTVTDESNGCTATATVTVFDNTTLPQVNASAPPITCAQPEVTLSGAGTSIGSNFAYQWTGPGIVSGSNGLFPTVNMPGTYTLVVTNLVNGCVDSASVTVVENTTPPQALIQLPEPLDCMQPTVTLSGAGSSTGQHSYQWDGPGVVSGGNTLMPVVNAPGTYVLVVTDNVNGCTDTAFVTVVDNSDPPIAVASVSNQLDCVHSTATLFSSGSTTGTGIQYTWTGPGIVSGQFSPTALVNAPGNYVLSVYNSNNGCASSAVVTVISDTAPPTVQIAQPPPFTCNTNWVTIQAAGTSTGNEFSYLWTTTDGVILTGQGTLTPIAGSPGTYVLEVTNTDNGCSASDSVTITSDTLTPVADAGPPQMLNCAHPEVTLQGSTSNGSTNNLEFLWIGPGIVSGETTSTPIVDQPGTYTLIVTNATNNCSDTASVVVDEDVQIPTAIIQPPGTLNCQDTVLQLDASQSSTGTYIMYTWTTTDGLILDGATTPMPTIGAPGLYILSVYNTTNQCSNIASVTVDAVYNYPIVDAGPDMIITCTTSEVVLDATNSQVASGQVIQWHSLSGNIVSGAQSLTPLVNEPGTYVLTITDTLSACAATDEVVVSVDANVPVADAGPDVAFNCISGDTLMLDASNSSSGPNFVYAWQTVEGQIISGDSTLMPLVGAPGTYELVVTNTQNGCVAFSSVTVGENYVAPIPTIASPEVINCTQSAVWLDASASTNADYYAWSTPDGSFLSDTLTASVVKVGAAGTYVLTLTNESSGCTVTDSVEVTEDFTTPLPQVAAVPLLTCAQPQVMIDATPSVIDSLTTIYWTTTDGHIIDGDSTLTPVVNAVGQYLLTLTHQLSQCVDSMTVTVVADQALPEVDAGQSFTLDCSEPQASLSGMSDSTMVVWWTTSDGQIVSGDSTLTPIVSSSGTYVLHAMNPQTGCLAQDSVVVQDDSSLPQIYIETPEPLSCYQSEVVLDATNSDSDSMLIITWETFDGHFVSGQNSLMPVVDAAGVYTLSIANPLTGCVSEESVTVQIDTTAPVVTIAPPPLMGCGINSVVLDASAFAQGANISYLWTTPDGQILEGESSATPVVGGPGTYVLTVHNTVNGCQRTDTAVVVQDLTQPQISVGEDRFLTCAQDTLIIQAQVASDTTNLVYQWIADSGLAMAWSGLSVVIDQPGMYVLLATDTVNNCSATDTLLVEADTEVPQAMLVASGDITCLQPQVLLDGEGSATGTYITYEWSTMDGALIDTATGPMAIATLPGTYVLTVLNTQNYCTDTASVVVGIDTVAPQIGVQPPPVLTCAQPQISLSGVVSTPWPFQALWTASNGGHIVSGAQTLTPQIDAVGTYTLTVTQLENGCSTELSVEVIGDFETPLVQIAPVQTLTCAVQAVVLDASASVGDSLAFAWSTTGGILVGDPTAAVVQATAPDTYHLMVTDLSNGCVTEESVAVQQDVGAPVVAVHALGQLTCAQTEVVVSGTGSTQGVNIAYAWSSADGLILSGEQQLNAIVGSAGTYVLEATNLLNGCTAYDSVVVTVDTVAPWPVVAPPTLLTCTQPQQVLDATASQPAGMLAAQWTTSDGYLLSGQQSLTPTVGAAGTYVLWLENTHNGCTAQLEVIVSEDKELPQVFVADPDPITCVQTQTTLVAQVDAATNDFSMQWTDNAGSPLSNDLSVVVQAPGWYQVQVIDLDNGCSTTEQVQVADERIYPQIVVSPPPLLTCAQEMVQLNATSLQGTPSDLIEWFTPDGNIVSGTQTLMPTVDAPGTYILEVTHGTSGCVTAHSVVVEANKQPPQVDAGPSQVLDCNQTQVVLQGSTSASTWQASWSTEDGHILSGTHTLQPTVDMPGVYELSVVDQWNGCSASDVVQVVRTVPEDILVEVVDPLCHGMTGAVSILEVSGGTPPYQYSIDGEDFSPIPAFAGLHPGTYAVLALDANGCIVSDTVEIIDPEPLELFVEQPEVLLFGDSVLLVGQSNVREDQLAQIQWTPVEGLSCDTCLVTWAKPFESNWYTLLLVDLNGCIAEETIFLRVDKRPAIYVPNAFSPDGDGYNDKFYPFAKEGTVREIRSFLVFDRWGEAVYRYEHFQPNDPTAGWDGTFRGRPLNPQVLVWYAVVELIDGRVITLKGDVTLVR